MTWNKLRGPKIDPECITNITFSKLDKKRRQKNEISYNYFKTIVIKKSSEKMPKNLCLR